MPEVHAPRAHTVETVGSSVTAADVFGSAAAAAPAAAVEEDDEAVLARLQAEEAAAVERHMRVAQQAAAAAERVNARRAAAAAGAGAGAAAVNYPRVIDLSDVKVPSPPQRAGQQALVDYHTAKRYILHRYSTDPNMEPRLLRAQVKSLEGFFLDTDEEKERHAAAVIERIRKDGSAAGAREKRAGRLAITRSEVAKHAGILNETRNRLKELRLTQALLEVQVAKDRVLAAKEKVIAAKKVARMRDVNWLKEQEEADNQKLKRQKRNSMPMSYDAYPASAERRTQSDDDFIADEDEDLGEDDEDEDDEDYEESLAEGAEEGQH